MNQPVIGITPDRNDLPDNIEAHFFVRRNYCAAVSDSGGLPIVLPYAMDLVPQYLNLLDGIVLTGGMFDIDPAAYGTQAKFPDKMCFKPDRTRFEQALLRGALERNIPLLGICGGMQLLAVELGAQLVQHIPSEIGTAIEHMQDAPCNRSAHRVAVRPASMLGRILGTEECVINSLHHQAVAQGNARLQVGALADDGVIESIEVPDRSFCLGIQWHPEYFVNTVEQKIFAALMKAAKGHAAHRRP